ncbi:hypothetical protein MAR_014711 [Mya arenaria]|uniref:C2H2-type domain-containing protein n=1 Tax=Mya arenaria TaxID=6604 RepID=A0ABY7FF29_MYAAR|nr:hypothetical protein MAR_014711 [Mya arenaria]
MGDELALERRVVRSELNELSTLLNKAGDECFIVTACVYDETPHLLGSIKGTDFVESKSLIVKTEFLQYLNESNLDASKVGGKHVEMSTPNVSFAQHSRPTDGNRSSQSVVPVKVKNVSDNVKVNTKRTNIDDQIKESPSLLLGKAISNEGTPRKANFDHPVVPITPAFYDNDNDRWSSSDDEFQEVSENDLPDMNAFIGRTPIKLDQDATRSVQSPPKLWSALQKRKEACQELESPNQNKQNEDNGIRSNISAGENERATKTIAGTSDECKQGTYSNTLEIQIFTCVVKGCSKEFTTRWPLLHHYQSHTDRKLITCRECDEQFKSSTSANKHCQRAHYDIENLKPQYPTRRQLEDLEREIMAKNTDGIFNSETKN